MQRKAGVKLQVAAPWATDPDSNDCAPCGHVALDRSAVPLQAESSPGLSSNVGIAVPQ